MLLFSDILIKVDNFVWGPFMLILLVGTGIFLTVRTKALCWRNLPYSLKCVFSRESRQKKGEGDITPFSALTTALAATIGTGNIVGVATAMVSGGPGALVWMWISAAFGLTSKFSECMLAIKYREVNENGEMSGGPMYTIKKGFRHKKTGAVLGWFFALFAVIASFGIGNLTQGNSISSALEATFGIPARMSGIVLMVLAMLIILGGIKSISKVSQVVVPLMALFYIAAAILVIIGNLQNVPSGLAMIFQMAFSMEAVGGGLCGSLTASLMQALRFGVARGVFSNEAGMGSAAITAAAATASDPVRQGYINMTGTFWDTIVVCTLTGLCIASSGTLGSTATAAEGTCYIEDLKSDCSLHATAAPVPNKLQTAKACTSSFTMVFSLRDIETQTVVTSRYEGVLSLPPNTDAPTVNAEILTDAALSGSGTTGAALTLTSSNPGAANSPLVLSRKNSEATGKLAEAYRLLSQDAPANDTTPSRLQAIKTVLSSAAWTDASGNEYRFTADGSLEYRKLLTGAPLTIAAFKTVLGVPGGWLVCISIALFAFSTILGWEYHGEKAFEYLLGTHRFHMVYRIAFSLLTYVGATTSLQIAWNFSDIANALMAVPNLICLLVMSGTIAGEMERFQKIL